MDFNFDFVEIIETHLSQIQIFFLSLQGIFLLTYLVLGIFIGKSKTMITWSLPSYIVIINSVLTSTNIYLQTEFLSTVKGEPLSAVMIATLFMTTVFTMIIMFVGIIFFKNILGKSYAEMIKPDDFVMGETKIWDVKNRRIITPINPQFFVVDRDSFFTNWLIFGGTGSGKTTGFGLKMFQQFFSDTRPDKKPCMVIIDIKGDMYQSTEEWEHPRKKDIDVIGFGYSAVNMLGKDKPIKLANNMMKGFASLSDDGKVSVFHEKFQERFVRAALSLLHNFVNRNREFDDIIWKKYTIQNSSTTDKDTKKANFYRLYKKREILSQKFYTMRDLYDLAADENYLLGMVSYLQEYKDYYNITDYEFTFPMGEFYNLFNAKDFGSNLMGMLSDMSVVLNADIIKYFTSEKPYDFEEAINKGKIVFINVPQGELGPAIAKLIALQFLLQFISALEKRNSAISSSGMDTERVAFCIMDEASKFMCRELESVTATNRSAKGSFVMLTQSETQFGEIYRDALAGNLRSKAIYSVGSIETAETFVKLFGEEKLWKESYSRGKGNLAGKGSSTNNATNRSNEWTSKVSVDSIIELKEDHIFLSYHCNKKTYPLQVVNVFPWYLPQFNLFPVYGFFIHFNKEPKKEEVKKLVSKLKISAKKAKTSLRGIKYYNNILFFKYASTIQCFPAKAKNLVMREAKKTKTKNTIEMYQGKMDDLAKKLKKMNLS